MTGWNHFRNPYNSVSWAEGVERAIKEGQET